MCPPASGSWDLSDVRPPWGDRPSIYERIRAHPSELPEAIAVAGEPRAEEQGGWLRALYYRAFDRLVAQDLALDELAAEDLAAIGVHRPSAEARTAASIMGALKRAIRDTNDVTVRDTAVQVDDALGVDTWDHRFRRLGGGEDRWLGVMQTDDRERVERVVALALERIPLAEIATGPEGEDGIGPRFGEHLKLAAVVGRLEYFPGTGLPLVHAALQSPSSFNRNHAIHALGAWGESHWGPETRALLEAAVEPEPAMRRLAQDGR